MHRKRWFALAGVVAAASLTLLVAACGGDGKDGSQTTPTATKVAATEPARQTPTRAAPTATKAATTEPARQTPTRAATEPVDPPPTRAAPTPPPQTPTEPVIPPTVERVIVDVPHWEWVMTVSTDSAPAGTVTFNAINEGVIPHNLRLAKTGLAPNALPLSESTYMVIEEQLEVLASSRDLGVGESEELTVALAPGSYVLFCNIATHYQAGLYVGFSVN